MSLPLKHLSASSLSLFLRCPRQWQEHYLRGEDGPSNSALIIGSAVHLGLARVLKGVEPGSFFEDVVEIEGDREIIWKDSPEVSKRWAEKMLYHYYERVGKFLDVEDTEKEIYFEIPGVDIPLLAYVDIVTPRGIIDVKTTGYLNKNVRLNREWKLQANIYQIPYNYPAEFHVLTRAKNDPLIVPDSPNHKLYVPVADRQKMLEYVGKMYKVMENYYEQFGVDIDWPGNLTQEWAERYCSVEHCCQRL